MRSVQDLLPRILRPALAAAGIALALAACGDFSLVESLVQEDAGELRFSPADPAIPTGVELLLSVAGGIPPYSVVSGAVTPVDPHTLQFEAQAASGDFPVQVSDSVGKRVETRVTVYAGGEPTLNVSELTLPEGTGWTFVVSGGPGPYDWELNGAYQATGISYDFLPAPLGTYIVRVIDRSAGASQAATVTVVPSGIGVAALSITPLSAVLMPGGQAVFTALGGDGAYAFSAPDGGTFAGANPVTYTPPAAVGTYAIELVDGGVGPPVFAEVLVTATGTLPVLSPGSVTVSAIDDEVQFSASEGSPPYVFSSGKPAIGSIDPVTGLYQQLAAGNVLVTVTDADGFTDNTLVRWKP